MFGSSASGLHPEQRRSPRFPFDSLVRVTASCRGEEAQVWGRSTDLCREGIGVTVTGELTPEEQARSGFEFVDLRNQQREAIEAACEKLERT